MAPAARTTRATSDDQHHRDRQTTWNDGRVDIDTIIYTADEMAEIFLPDEREALTRGEVVERGGRAGIRYVEPKAVALNAGL